MKKILSDVLGAVLLIAIIIAAFAWLILPNVSKPHEKEVWTCPPSVRFEDAVYGPGTLPLSVDPTVWTEVGTVTSTCPTTQFPTQNNQTNYNALGAKICRDPNSDNYLAVLFEDGRYSIHAKPAD